MKINKSLDIDLNIISPQKKHIRIHEGDVDSVDILIGVTVDDESVDLTGVMIKYDATINNYLVEQDADGSVVNDKISIPVTQNMTAMSGLLLIDVRMIQNDQILFTQTICATVEKAVVNGSTYIDFDKITIIQRMNALEEKMDYIEELVENFDTSKLIVSVNRPPEGAPVEVDVDLLRVGDTWILSGANIVYKLVEAQYNYQPVPSAEPYHKFTWQPLNERFGVGNTEPPTTVTYQPVVYTINEVQWSWLPIPEYFQGDHYQMLVDGESTYYICVSGNMADTGVCTYTWREEGGASSGITIINIETVPESSEWGDSIPANYAGNTGKAGEIAYWEEDGYFWGLCSLATDPITGNINYNWVQQADEIDIDNLKSDIATKMDLAPLNPTAAQIAAMPSGQIYDDVTKKIVTIKGGTELSGVIRSSNDPEYAVPIGSLGQLLRYGQLFYICDGNNWKPVQVADSNVIKARATLTDPDGNYTITSSVALQVVWELFTKFHCVKISLTDQYGQDVGRTCLILRVTGNNHEHLSAILLPYSSNWSNGFAYNRVHFLEQHAEGSSDTLRLETKYVYPPREQYLTLETLPIYDGTVI